MIRWAWYFDGMESIGRRQLGAGEGRGEGKERHVGGTRNVIFLGQVDDPGSM